MEYGIPQLMVSPSDSASLILSDSIFTSAQLTLTGISGVGPALSISGINNNDIGIVSSGGLSISGSILINHTGTTGSLVTQGGVYIEKGLYVNSDITVAGDIILGSSTGDYNSDLFFGPPGVSGTYKISHDTSVNGGRLLIYMYNTSLSSYDLLMKLEKYC